MKKRNMCGTATEGRNEMSLTERGAETQQLLNAGNLVYREIIEARYYPHRVFSTFEIDLNRLSKPAHDLVNGISTTDNRVSSGEVMVSLPYTPREIDTFLGLGDWYDDSNASYVPHERDDCLCQFKWGFDSIKRQEDPESYFERQIKRMKVRGGIKFSSKWLSLEHYFSNKGDNGQTEFSLYESDREKEVAAERYRENCLAIGSIVENMKERGTCYNNRSFFAQYALDEILPRYYMRNIPDEDLDQIREIAERYSRL